MSAKLYVGNLSGDTTEARLRDVFSRAGTVKSVTIPLDEPTHTPRGFAWIEMGTAGEATQAIRLCDGEEVDGHPIHILRRHSGLESLLGH
jgi:RNA recognition motif-containing protein